MQCCYYVKRGKQCTYFASIFKVRYILECIQKNLKTLLSNQCRPQVTQWQKNRDRKEDFHCNLFPTFKNFFAQSFRHVLLFATPWTRLPCSPPFSQVCSNSWPLSKRCHPTISSSMVGFSSSLHSFPAPGSYQ